MLKHGGEGNLIDPKFEIQQPYKNFKITSLFLENVNDCNIRYKLYKIISLTDDPLLEWQWNEVKVNKIEPRNNIIIIYHNQYI